MVRRTANELEEHAMSEHETSSSADGGASASHQGGSKRRRFMTGLAAGGLLGGLLATAFGTWSNAHGGPGGWHDGARWCRASKNPEAQRERAEFATDWVLNKLDATDAQRTQVKAIVAGTLQELAPLRDQHRQHREAFLAALAQPDVDRATLEDLRRAELQLAENASQRIVTAVADAAAVLTPEQRAELVKMAERFRH
jgi:Spy/CpxP family protein refolding chaperone